MLGLLAWGVFLVMASVDGVQNSCQKESSRQRSVATDNVIFYDKKGRTFLTKYPNIQVHWSIEEYYDPVTGHKMRRDAYYNVKNFKLACVQGGRYDYTLRKVIDCPVEYYC